MTTVKDIMSRLEDMEEPEPTKLNDFEKLYIKFNTEKVKKNMEDSLNGVKWRSY